MDLWINVKDSGGDHWGGGLNRSLINFFHKNSAYDPRSKLQVKTLKKVMKNTNQQDINDPHRITKLAEK
jgi:hypothetical protein